MNIAKEPNTEKHGSGKAASVLRIIGTILLIGVVTGLIFVCIFAFYVKTCITPSLDLDLNDFTLKQSSIIYYSREALEEVHEDIESFAKSEQLTAHANSIAVRFE